jgi:hypothetical protein
MEVGMSRNRAVAYGLGAIYTLVGILGFFMVDEAGFTGRDFDDNVFGFAVNHLHNIVHLLIGLALLGAARAGYRPARSMNLAIGGTYLLVALIGFFIAAEDNDANILNLNGADNILHLVTGAVLVAVAMMEKDYVEHDRERDRTSTI